MAIIGQQLATPETGWRRYDDNDSRIKYDGTWTHATSSSWYNNTTSGTSTIGGTLTFKFYGSKFRLVQLLHAGLYNGGFSLYIDGVKDYDLSYNNAGVSQNMAITPNVLIYEKLGLTLGTHIIKLVCSSAMNFDAMDIDDTGYLMHPVLNQISSLDNMQAGDCIPCRYTAPTSGAAGYFSELGTCIKDEIPIVGTATPDGLFYLIKTDKGTLIADRVLQTSISWDTLNSTKFIEGIKYGYLVTEGITPIAYHQAGVGYSTPISTTLGRKTNSFWSGIADDSTSAAIYDLGRLIKVASIIINTMNTNLYTKSIDIYGSNDNVSWVKIGSYSLVAGDNQIVLNSTCRYFKLTNAYRSDNRYVNTLIYIFFIYDNYSDVPPLNKTLIHSLSGGCAYADANGNKTLTNANKGAWPTNNEWDKYIVNSDLKGKIIAGDDNIWHWNSQSSLCKDTPINGFVHPNTSVSAVGSNIRRIVRSCTGNNKYCYFSDSNNPLNYIGFRPILNYVESDIASEVIY